MPDNGIKYSPFQQVTLSFQPKGKGATISWNGADVDKIKTTFRSPYPSQNETLYTVIKALDAIQYPDYPINGPLFSSQEKDILIKLKLWQYDRVIPSISQAVGLSLYNGLGLGGTTALDIIRNKARAKGLITNYVLRFPEDAVELAALPWELLRDIGETILFEGHNHSMERYIDIDKPLKEPLPKGEKPHLLALLPSYNISEEIHKNEQLARLATWQKLRDLGLITFDEIYPLTRSKLYKYLHDRNFKPPDIVHYFGHGIYRDGVGYLFFNDDKDIEKVSMVSASSLKVILRDIRLIVLQACQSSMVDMEQGLLTGIAPALCVDNEAVLAMQLSVSIEAATSFTEVFYEDLLVKGRSLQEAVAEGRRTLFFVEGELVNWYVPTLYIRSHDQKPIYFIQT